ncbi:MAG: FecR domain-containing protein, partial [Spirochaetales bacterium]|nr:FecR domain-containing protein [Spirochaetales bacterium]
MKTSLATITILAVSLSLAVSCGGTDSADKPAAPAPSTQADTQTTPAETAATAAAPAASEQAATTSPGQGAESAPTETTPTETAGSTSQGSPQASSPASAAPVTQRELGEIVFAEGSVSIHRAGAQPEAADIGSIVRQYDVLVTGPKSRAEVDLGSGSAGGASVKLTENTAFYFDTKELGEAERKTVLQLLTGALAIKVDKLANGSFSVATEQAVLGVRGTVFIVDTVPDGSLLVTCDSGAVAVSADGSTTTAKPGAVVELPQAGDLRLLAVEPADLSSYRGEWRVDAYKSFASRALSYTSAYAATIESGKPAFEAALAKLDAQ